MSTPWSVLVVDDDEAVLRLSELMLGRVQVDGRPLRLVLCRNSADARTHLATEQYAVAILDVVMESEHAGLDLVREMRAEPRHALTPIVVRTGQPGAYPEARVLQEFRISDYWRKDDLQPHRIRASITGLIRSYDTALELERRAREREVLLREIHHRVKNNLQIISSLVRLQRDQIADASARSLLDDTVLRVRSMALVHEQLYGVDGLESIEFAAYTRALVDSIQPLAPRARVAVVAAPCPVSIDLAIPLGLIVNELVTNALKYGADRVGGRLADDRDVEVQVALDAGRLRITVTDAGPGLPAGFDPGSGGGLGMQLIRSLARQIRAELRWNDDGGAQFEVTAAIPG